MCEAPCDVRKARRVFSPISIATPQESCPDAEKLLLKRSQKAYRWYLRGWLPKDKNAAIADLGCGAGHFLFFLQSMGFVNIRGVDISTEQVNRAKSLVPHVECDDVLVWMSHQQTGFDVLTAFDVLEHLTRSEAMQFLTLAHDLLNPDGTLLLQTPNAASLGGMAVRYTDPTHEWCYTPSHLTSLLKSVGFSEVELREQGPIPIGYSLASTVRWVVWQALRIPCQIWWIAETGQPPSILTRVMLARARK